MMDSEITPLPVTLVERLQRCAEIYAATPDGSLARLGKRAVNDGAFFDRLGERGPTTATLEKFARYLADPANWPGADVPAEALDFAHVCGVTAPDVGASAGPEDSISPLAQERAA